MTREEAISIMKIIVHMLEEKYDTDRVEEAVDMAIEALQQKPICCQSAGIDCEDCPASSSEKPKSENKVLKNIRLDIALKYIPKSSDVYGDEAKWINMGLRMALEVIDKYKAERSDTE